MRDENGDLKNYNKERYFVYLRECYLKANLEELYSSHAKNENTNFLTYIWSLPVFPKEVTLECVVEYSSVSYLLFQTATSN